MTTPGSPAGPEGRCHCGAVRLVLPRVPASITNCNCSTCRRYGALWCYFPAGEVTIDAAPAALASYAWGDRDLRFVRCATCGCVTHWQPFDVEAGAPLPADTRIGVNARMFDPLMFGDVHVRRLDGADTWQVLD